MKRPLACERRAPSGEASKISKLETFIKWQLILGNFGGLFPAAATGRSDYRGGILEQRTQPPCCARKLFDAEDGLAFEPTVEEIAGGGREEIKKIALCLDALHFQPTDLTREN